MEQENILVSAISEDGKHYSFCVQNLLVIAGVNLRGFFVYDYSHQATGNISDLWWESIKELYYRCQNNDYVIEVPQETPTVLQSMYKGFFHPNRIVDIPLETQTEKVQISTARALEQRISKLRGRPIEYEYFSDISWNIMDEVSEVEVFDDKSESGFRKCENLECLVFHGHFELQIELDEDPEEQRSEEYKTILVSGTARNVLQEIHEAYRAHEHQFHIWFEGISLIPESGSLILHLGS
jgi:hypothetical protein